MAKKAKSGGKICPEGKAWAKRTFDTYPSAYLNIVKIQTMLKNPKLKKVKEKSMLVAVLPMQALEL